MSLARLLFSKSTSSRELSTRAATRGVSVVPDASAESFSGAPCVSGTCTKVAEQSNIALVRRYTSPNASLPTRWSHPTLHYLSGSRYCPSEVDRKGLCRPRAGYLMRLREPTSGDADPSRAGRQWPRAPGESARDPRGSCCLRDDSTSISSFWHNSHVVFTSDRT